ncbi:hypothetical protein RIF29_27132 [Crotalaria pallida]|uniref:HTH myb-type domain-containing protein n=1 Tax=Crotalaria pallida TaxID=3830 RepID=A0AAN9ENI8_CROPI
MNKKMHKNNKKNKGRVTWSVELHRKFVAAVNQLGIHKAVPRKILELMNEENLTTAHIGSHLQKYRLRLQRNSARDPNQQGSQSDDSESEQFQDDASYHSNVNVATVDSEWYTSTNSTFNRNLDFNFCDQLQMEHDWIMELIQGTSSLEQQHQAQRNRQKYQNNCIANNIGSVEDLNLITASTSCSQPSRESEEIAKLRQEISELRQDMSANRVENHRLCEMVVQELKAQHEMLMQAVSCANAAAAARVDPTYSAEQ